MPRKKLSDKLTIQQRGRVDSALVRRRARADHPGEKDPLQDLGAEEEGLVVAHFGQNVEVAPVSGTPNLRCAVRETLAEAPVCGDRVQFRPSQSGGGVVVSVGPRRNTLRRPAAMGRVQTVAANVDRLVIITTATRLNPGLLDRYLVAAAVSTMEPLLVVNKIDLLTDSADLKALKRECRPYRQMGYQVIQTSVPLGLGMRKLARALTGLTSVVVGQSGVGKTTLIAQWIQDPSLRVAEVSEVNGRGRHTTTVARLYPLPEGGAIIDSPGIRSFGLSGVSAAELPGHFRDVAPYLGRCQFSSCSHQEEPGCAVLKAMKRGHIDPRRLDSLFRIMESFF